MNNPQGVPTAAVPTPADVLEALQLATAKVSVLKEQEIKLARDNSMAQKAYAELLLKKEELDGAILKLQDEEVSAKKSLDAMKLLVDEQMADHGKFMDEFAAEKKALEKAQADEAIAKENLETYLAKVKALEGMMAAEKADFEAEKASWAARRDAVVASLKSIM